MKATSIHPSNLSPTKRTPDIPPWMTRFQVSVGIVISVATVFISWQTFQLTERTQETTAKLKEIEQQLAENKFGFEQIRDIYDRTEKYLSAEVQDASRGRVLVVLIGSLPDSRVRSDLLVVVTEQAKLSSIAAKAADFGAKAKTQAQLAPPATIGPSGNADSSPPTSPPSRGFSGNLALSLNGEKYTATTVGDFQFIDSQGTAWKVPKGTVVTGAAVPRLAWSIAGPPLSGNYATASVLLEYHSQQRKASTQDVHRMFYDALVALNMPISQANALHLAITSFGPQ